MKKEAVEPELIDRCILELASESGLGGSQGRSLSAIYSIMGDRGFDREDVNTSLEILLKKKLVQQRNGHARSPFADMGAQFAVTTDGKDHLRRLRATTQFNIRVPDKVREELEAVAREGETAPAVAVRALREWVRTEKFPGIAFRWAAGGRRPYVQGTGLSVWEVFHIWREFEKSAERVAKAYPYLKADKVNVAVAYAQAYVDEMPVGEWGEKPPFAREFKV